MVEKYSKRKLFLWAAIVAVLVCIITYWRLIPISIIVKNQSGVVLSIPTYANDTFSLRFTHSVHKTPVWENFVVEGVEKLMLTSTEYRSYGVGMPSLPSEGVFTQLGDRFLLTNINRPFKEIPVRVGPEAKLSLYHGEQEYPLHEWFEPGTLLFISTNYDYIGFIFPSVSRVK